MYGISLQLLQLYSTHVWIQWSIFWRILSFGKGPKLRFKEVWIVIKVMLGNIDAPCLMSSTANIFGVQHTPWRMSKYGVLSRPRFPVFGLNAEIYSVNFRFQSEYRGKYEPDKTPYLGTFHAVRFSFCITPNRILNLLMTKVPLI